VVAKCGFHLDLGIVPYDEAWVLQRRVAAARAEDRLPDTLLTLQHPHTYTLGRSGHAEHLLMSQHELAARGIGLFEVDRGGDITYHGPGQLVGYPIFYLGQPGGNGRLPRVDYIGYLRRIEAALIQALAAWGISGRRFEGYTGVWVDQREPLKIAAIGVKVNGQGISQHGFALNVDPDLSFFQGIVPCGIHDRGVTSMRRLLCRELDLEEVVDAVAAAFGRVFGLSWQGVSLEAVEGRVSSPSHRAG
jgi:lipoyl(octanoyl) transferase